MKDLEKIITKELLRRVLPKETENLSNNFSFYIDEDNIVFNDDGEMQFEYCIYKFAFLCKEWALTKGYFIYSTNELSFIKTFKDTEIESIIESCEWILSEVNK